MADPEPKRFFSFQAAFIGAAAASLLALPVLLLDLYKTLGPTVRPVAYTNQQLAVYRPTTPLPPLLSGLIDLEYQRKGVDGVVDLMKRVDAPIYKDIVYAYLITMLLGQNSDIRGVSTYEPTPFGTQPYNAVPSDPLPVTAPAASKILPLHNTTPARNNSDNRLRTMRASFEQNKKQPTDAATPMVDLKTDQGKIAQASRLARLIAEPDYRIFMQVEIAKAISAVDKNAPFDAAIVPDAIKVLNDAHKHLIGYHPSSVDSLELAQQLEHAYAALRASGYTPAGIRKAMRAKAETYLDEFIDLPIPYPTFDPDMRQLAHADSIIDAAMSRGLTNADEDRKTAAARSEAIWASVKALSFAGLSGLVVGVFTPLVTTTGRWLLRKSATLTRSDMFIQEADHVLKAKTESSSKKTDHEDSSPKG